MESDGELLLRLRSGDERAFVSLVERYHEPMLHLAASFVPSRAVAEEVVQDTWLALLRGLEGFEGRSSPARSRSSSSPSESITDRIGRAGRPPSQGHGRLIRVRLTFAGSLGQKATIPRC